MSECVVFSLIKTASIDKASLTMDENEANTAVNSLFSENSDDDFLFEEPAPVIGLIIPSSLSSLILPSLLFCNLKYIK